MGKIRVKALGDEEKEKKQKEEARKRAEAKKAEKASDVVGDEVKHVKETPVETPKTVSSYAKKAALKDSRVKHSQKYMSVVQLVDTARVYSLAEALDILPKLQVAKFDETVELHINTNEKGISGSVTLPHGTGKQVRIAIANQSDDPKAVEALVKNVESGTIDFDVLIATPDAMPKLAKIARILGPRGLMPNPKNGTVSPKPEEVAKRFQGGHVNFKTEAKFPLLHLSIGKVSFGKEKLLDNAKAAIGAVQGKNIKNITLKSTMSPGLKVELSSAVSS